ncbi:hypothetical protein GCK72_018434 [Caenorhabditis remanei]|uniref:Distal membrane-arm assembly complex protein 1-like domain-containing protein n=2 Tax=Caenorhabditis remanei TaxID=31234 RepID=A0A6A5GA22_CAERE|nr:hypothetical protein GCK72_018434 [Caenorhabditis remanei]KAF1751880.1 hypothetical protein GCK72_018434 [Caenorhabditis remanei]
MGCRERLAVVVSEMDSMGEETENWISGEAMKIQLLAPPDTSQPAAEQDCVSCKIIGTASLFGIGCYIIFATRPVGYYATRPVTRQIIRSLSAVPFYASVARWFYLPPFESIDPTKHVKH